VKILKNKKGFTLVEVIVVLVILAILSAIAIPALMGYIDKASNSKIKQDTRTAVTALQAWASEKYAEGIIGDALQDGAELSPYSPEVKAGQPLSGAAYPKYNIGIDAWNSTTIGTRISMQNIGAAPSGMSCIVFWDGEFKESKALSANTTVTIAPYTEGGLATGAHTVGVVLINTSQLNTLKDMSYAELKGLGLVKEGKLDNKDNNTMTSSQITGSSTGCIKSAPIMDYNPAAAHPAVNATYIWKEIVDSYAKNGIADDDNVILDYVEFDEKNKVNYIEYQIKDGNQIKTCVYDGEKYTLS
jgi:prepilin-type N-terminal cleavage/methylation domain-containing protein